MVAIDLNKQQEVDAGSKEIQQINFTGNLGVPINKVIFFLIEEPKVTVLDFSKGTVKVL